MDRTLQPDLPPGDAVGSPHLLTQGGQEDNQLMGSTSCAVTASWAFLFSTRVVTVSTPARRTGGLLVGSSPLLAAFFLAQARNLCFFSCFVSGWYSWASFSFNFLKKYFDGVLARQWIARSLVSTIDPINHSNSAMDNLCTLDCLRVKGREGILTRSSVIGTVTG